jgi:hypothetical protein
LCRCKACLPILAYQCRDVVDDRIENQHRKQRNREQRAGGYSPSCRMQAGHESEDQACHQCCRKQDDG